jgi:hypothetical protein
MRHNFSPALVMTLKRFGGAQRLLAVDGSGQAYRSNREAEDS